MYRQLLIISGAVPIVLAAVLLAFAWPAARQAPRSLPIGVVGSHTALERLVQGLGEGQPGAFDVTVELDDSAARADIRHRVVYGAFELRPDRLTVLTASAASPTVAQLLAGAGQHLAGQLASGDRPMPVAVDDVVAIAAGDPRGLVLSSSVLPLVFGGVIIAVAVTMLLRLRSAWRLLAALACVSVAGGLVAYAIAQCFLGALPGEHLACMATIALLLLSISATTAGLFACVGMPGVALAAASMIFVGNPFAAMSSAPEMLPTAARDIGQWMPPGAGGNLLRSAAYFHGNGAQAHLAVLVAWVLLGAAAVVVGSRRTRSVHAEIRTAEAALPPSPSARMRLGSAV
jgi:hypothetical protein